MRSLLALIIILTLTFPVSAQEVSPDPPVQAIPPGDDQIVQLKKGQPAPFDGQLFDPLTALRWANWLQQYKYRLVWDVERVQQTCKAETKYRDDVLAAEEERAKKVEDDLTSRLERSEQARLAAEEEVRNPPWYSTTTFGVVVGVVATAAIFGIAVAAIDATRSP